MDWHGASGRKPEAAGQPFPGAWKETKVPVSSHGKGTGVRHVSRSKSREGITQDGLEDRPGRPRRVPERATSAEPLPAWTEKDKIGEASPGLSICRQETGGQGSQDPLQGTGKGDRVEPQPRGGGLGGRTLSLRG